MTDKETLNEKIRQLNDLQLALLSCLIIDQHCIIEVHEQAITRLSYELGEVSMLFTWDDSMGSSEHDPRYLLGCLDSHTWSWIARARRQSVDFVRDSW